MPTPIRPVPKGRGSGMAPPNRFDSIQSEPDREAWDLDPEAMLAHPDTQYLPDQSQSIVTENDSPDIGFRFSINPYRGCEHGCSYCYARPSHEYLGLTAGLDFETKIFVKHDAPDLFREFLCRPTWRPQLIVLSGVTDPYQPVERNLRLTRGCLAVAAEARQPLGVITKNAGLIRDLDLLRQLAAVGAIHANVSITTLDADLGRTLEPRTSSPAARLRTVRALAEAGVPVRVMVAPVIPGLTDSELPGILAAAREAGAQSAGYVLLRLPYSVKPVFLDWLSRNYPLHQPRVESLLRGAHGGQLYNSKFGHRQHGSGEVAEQIQRVFRVFTRKLGLDRPLPELDASRFEPPRPKSGQLSLF